MDICFSRSVVDPRSKEMVDMHNDGSDEFTIEESCTTGEVSVSVPAQVNVDETSSKSKYL